MSKSIEITCHSCHGLLRLVEVPTQDSGNCPDCGAQIDLKEYLPDLVQTSIKADDSFYDDFPKRTELAQNDTDVNPGNSFNERADFVPQPYFEEPVKQAIQTSTAQEVNVSSVVDTSYNELQKNVPTSDSAINLGFSNRLKQMESDLQNLISRKSQPQYGEVDDAYNTSTTADPSLVVNPVVENFITETKSDDEKLKNKFDTLDAVHQQLRSEHANLATRFRNLEEEKNKIAELHSTGATSFIKGKDDTNKIVTYEKEKNKILKQKWQESLLQLRKSEEQMKMLANQLIDKEKQLKQREDFVTAARLKQDAQLSELEKQSERIRQEAVTRSSFERKISELTREVEILKETAENNEYSRQHLETLLRERDTELLHQKQNFNETQEKINTITKEIVEREQVLASQLLEVENARTALETDASKLEDEKANLKKLVAELNQRLADVQESEERVSKELSNQEIYKNAFANERAELDQLRNDIIQQREEVEVSKKQLIEKNIKVTEIQNLLISDKQAFEADRVAWQTANTEKLSKENELKISEKELTVQRIKLSETERLLADKESQLQQLDVELNKKAASIDVATEEIKAKKDALLQQEDQLEATTRKLKEGEDSYDRSISVYNNDIKSISDEKLKLESVRKRIKDDFVALEVQKKEFDEYRKRMESSINEQKDLLSKKEQGDSQIQVVGSINPRLSSPSEVLDAKQPHNLTPVTRQQDVLSNKRYSPPEINTDKKKRQYRRFDEAQATTEYDSVKILNPTESKSQQAPDLKSVVNEKVEAKKDEVNIKHSSKTSIPTKGSRKPLPVKAVGDLYADPLNVKEQSKSGKSLDEFGTILPEGKESSKPNKKAKNKVFWSAIISIPFICAGVLAVNKLKESDLSLPKLQMSDTLAEVETTIIPEEDISFDLNSIENDAEMNMYAKDIDVDLTNKLNEELAKQDNASPSDVIESLKSDSIDASETLEILNELPVEKKNIVLAKPNIKQPLHDPQDSNKLNHIGMLPKAFLD